MTFLQQSIIMEKWARENAKNGKEDTMGLPSTAERVPVHTKEGVNEKIRKRTEEDLGFYASCGPSGIERRLKELEREWDTERCLETGASTLTVIGTILGATVSRKWFLLPGIVGAFLLQHAIQGWCPPLAVLRRLGVRTMREIDQERYSLKAARGDFEVVSNTVQEGKIEAGKLLEVVGKTV